MSGYATRLEKGFIWPADDIGCAAVVFKTLSDLDAALNACGRKRVAIQAGGNAGVWPKHLAGIFDTVYTFEPDPLNFWCLAQNCPEPNIIKMQAALGCERGLIGLSREQGNSGAHYVIQGGAIPTLRIDDLGLTACDLICLDIEGSEMNALTGGIATILAHKPVIHIEDKGLSMKYGTERGEVVRWLIDQVDYKVIARPNNDVILVHASKI